jgi:hypothetical protein
MIRTRSRIAWCGVVLALATVVSSTRTVAGDGNKETFTGTAIPIGVGGPSAATQFTAYIDSFCTDEERIALAKAVIQGGQPALLKVLRGMKHGRISFGQRVGYDINAAVSLQTEQGRIVRIALDRPIAMFEARNSTRSRDYPIGFLEFTLDEKGEGGGQMIIAAQVGFDKKGTLELESYSSNPIKIQGVQSH